jgi:hypothetical protein
LQKATLRWQRSYNMNFKPTLLVETLDIGLDAVFFESRLDPIFNIDLIDCEKTYDKSTTVIVVDWVTVLQQGFSESVTKLRDKGIRCVIDHCYDCWDSSLDASADYTLRPRDFCRISESLWYKHLEYDKFDLTRTPTKDFLLLMNGERPWRDNLFNRIKNQLNDNIYSYVGKGIALQNAEDLSFNETTWQRFTDPKWYNDTRYSIVSESDPGWIYKVNPYPIGPNNWIWISEKSFKPCAFKHPFITFGPVGILKEMQRLGFETFSHCIDETYDLENNIDTRLEKIATVIESNPKFDDSRTLEIVEHNYNHFYNEEIVETLFLEQIVDPLLEFIES